MAFVDDRARPEMGHHIILEEREQLVVSGVEEVESFDEGTILLTTVQGGLEIQGWNGGRRHPPLPLLRCSLPLTVLPSPNCA